MKAGKTLVKVIATMLVAGGLLGGAPAASASDQRVEIEVDTAWMFMQQTGTETYNGYRMLVTPADPLQLSGEIYPNGSFRVPSDQFKLETSVMQGGMLGDIRLTSAGDVDGSFDQATGEMDLDFPAKMELEYTAGSGGVIKCEITGFDIATTTKGALNPGAGRIFEADPFVSGAGKMLGGWATPIADLVSEGVDGTPDITCEAVGGTGDDSFVGKLWMNAKAQVVDTTPPVPSFSTKLKLSPAKRSLEAGKKTSLRLLVENGLESARKIRISFRASNRKVSVRKSIVIRVPANSVAVAMVDVEAARNAKGISRITATTEDQTSIAMVNVKATAKKLKVLAGKRSK